MDPQAYNSPTYTHVNNDTYTYTNSTLISTYTYINNTPYSATIYLLPFTFLPANTSNTIDTSKLISVIALKL